MQSGEWGHSKTKALLNCRRPVPFFFLARWAPAVLSPVGVIAPELVIRKLREMCWWWWCSVWPLHAALLSATHATKRTYTATHALHSLHPQSWCW